MSTIATTTPANSALASMNSTPATTKVGAQAGQTQMNQFLQLLTTQLKNQNPTQPTDPTQFVAQLAQFSTVEQSVQTNATLTTISKAMSGMALSQYSGLVNHTVTSDISSVSVPASGVVSTPMEFRVTDTSLANPRVVITNASGGVVGALKVNGASGSVTFDGTDGTGRRLPPGTYNVNLVGNTGVGNQMRTVAAGTLGTSGVVTGVIQGEAGDWQLKLKNGQSVPASSITSSS